MPPRKRTPPSPPEPLDETKAHDLLPPEPSAPPPPRKIGLRRVVGHGLGERLLARRGWRPAGNSRRFWSKIEDDDPFLPRPPGSKSVEDGAVGFSVGSTHDVYAADRISRTTGVGPAPKGVRQTHTPETQTAPTPRRAPPPAPKPSPPTPKPP